MSELMHLRSPHFAIKGYEQLTGQSIQAGSSEFNVSNEQRSALI
jgi:hypothetical protein